MSIGEIIGNVVFWAVIAFWLLGGVYHSFHLSSGFYGGRRVVNKFLLFPLKLDGKRRWMCRALVEQERVYHYYSDCMDADLWSWDNVHWADKGWTET